MNGMNDFNDDNEDEMESRNKFEEVRTYICITIRIIQINYFLYNLGM